jgi:hypothetical protein
MDEQKDSELDELLSQEEEGLALRRRPTLKALLIASAAILLVAGAFWALGHLSFSGERDRELRERALANSWQQAQEDEARGVDFEMEVSNSDLPGDPTMTFHHSGSVSLVDDCFEASSKYIVLEDGSLAIEGLSDARTLGATDCDSDELSPLFYASKMGFGNDGWTAYGADGEKLLGGLMESRPSIPAEPEADAE